MLHGISLYGTKFGKNINFLFPQNYLKFHPLKLIEIDLNT